MPVPPVGARAYFLLGMLVGTKCYSDEYISLCDGLWQRCKDLNARGLERIAA